MGAFQSVPDEVLLNKVCELIGESGSTNSYHVKKLLALRATCKSGHELVRRIIASKAICLHLDSFRAPGYLNVTEPREMPVSARVVEAAGRVFGPCCTRLYASGCSPERIAALEVFVSRTTRLLRLELELAAVSEEVLLRICRMLPQLEDLFGPKFTQTSEGTIRAISACCPNIRRATFSPLGRVFGDYSPAETWARYFPKLREFNLLGGRLWGYQPTRIEIIHECALVSQADSLDLDQCFITAAVIEAIVGTPLGDRISNFGSSGYDPEMRTNIEPAAFLAAARGFPKLEDVYIPRGSTMGGPGFYIDLSRAAPQIVYIEICDASTSDACVAAICRHLPLVNFTLTECRNLTSSIVESITGGQAARTLTHLTISYSAEESLRAVDMLRLVSGCPELHSLEWVCTADYHASAELDAPSQPCQAIHELLESRGGNNVCYAFGEHDPDWLDPNWIFESSPQ